MSMQSNLLQYLTSLAMTSPMILVLTVGFILALLQLGRSTRVALFLAAGTGILLMNLIVMTGVQIWGMSSITSGRDMRSIQIFLQVLGAVRSLVSAVGMALLITAALVGRNAGRNPGSSSGESFGPFRKE